MLKTVLPSKLARLEGILYVPNLFISAKGEAANLL